MNYTNEQLKAFAENLELFEPMEKILKALGTETESLSMKDLGIKLDLTTYPRDKALLALEYSGFVFNKFTKSKKLYRITEEGRRLLGVMGGNNG